MKKIILILGLCFTATTLSSCGNKNYSINDIISEDQLASRGFSAINSSYPERGQAYISDDNNIVVYYQNGVFGSSHLASGQTIEMVNVNGTIYLANSEHTMFINNSDCLVDNQPQPLSSQACSVSQKMSVKYNDFIKEHFKKILK